MSDSQPIDLSELQSLSFRPDWVAESKPVASDAPAAEVVWNFTEARGGRSGGGGRDDRGPRRDGDRPQNRGPRNDGGGRGFGGPGQNRGGGNERRGPGGPGGFGGPPGGGQRSGPGGGGRPPGPGGFANRPPGGGGGAPGGQRRPDDRGPRPDGGGNRGPRPEGANRGPRPEGGNRGPRREGDRGPRGRDDRRDDRNFDDRPRLPEGWFVRLLPEPRAVEALSKQIKASGRAYSVFDVAKLFLSGRDRYLLHFYFKKPARGEDQPKDAAPATETAAPELLQCTLDGSLWLTREEAIRHIREGNAMNDLYREEVVEVDPPKGVFQSIAVCGFSGALLGPPNHHSFPVAVSRLHREQFYNVPLDRYKSRIQIEKGEEIVQKWLEQQSKERQWVATKVPEGEEAPRFKTLAERDAHFFKNHADEVLKSVREVTVGGNIPGKHLSPGLLAVLRMELDRQNRFPMHLVQELCRELEVHGLRFFKRDKKTTFVSRSRPQFIGSNITLSDRVRSIVEMVRANPGIGYGKVVSVLAPPAPVVEPATPPAEGEAAAAETTPVPTLSTGELAIMQDIKWLVQEGFITEFANGELHILGRERPHDEPSKEPREKKGPKQKPQAPTEADATAVEGESDVAAAELSEAEDSSATAEEETSPAPEAAAPEIEATPEATEAPVAEAPAAPEESVATEAEAISTAPETEPATPETTPG